MMASARSSYRLLSVCVLCATLAACGNVKQQLGLARNSPDEFTVVQRAPLSMPPDYTLRPPEPGARPLSEQNVAANTRASVFGSSADAADVTDSDSAFLNQIGATNNQPDIRRTIERERGVLALESQTVADKLIFWKDTPPDAQASLVDPAAEAERLKQAQENNQPVNTGEVPVIEKKTSVIDKLF